MIEILRVQKRDAVMDVLVGKEGMKIQFFPNGFFKSEAIIWKIAEFPKDFIQAAHDAYKYYYREGDKGFPFTESSGDVQLNGKFTPTESLPEDRSLILSISGMIGSQTLDFSLEFDVFELNYFIGQVINYWDGKIV